MSFQILLLIFFSLNVSGLASGQDISLAVDNISKQLLNNNSQTVISTEQAIFNEEPAIINHSLRVLEQEESYDRPTIPNRILQTFSLVSMLIGNFIAPNDLSFLFPISLAKIPEYNRFINISFPDQIFHTLSSIRAFSVSFSLSFPAPQSLKGEFPQSSLPAIFELNGLYSSFLLNEWGLAISFGFVLLIVIFLELLQVYSVSYKKAKLNSCIQRLKIVIRWNLLFIIVFNSYDDITFFSLIEVRTLSLGSAASIISFLFYLLIIAFALFGVAKMIVTSYKSTKNSKSKLIKEAPSEVKRDLFKILNSGFKQDMFLYQSYPLWFICRIILCYIIVGCFEGYPLLQSMWILTLSMAMLYYLINERPYKNRIKSNISVFLEIIVTLNNLCLVVLAFSQGSGTSEQVFSYFALIFKISLGLVSHLSVWIYAALSIHNAYKAAKLKNKNKNKGITLSMFWTHILQEPLNKNYHPDPRIEVKVLQSPSEEKTPTPLIVINQTFFDRADSLYSQKTDRQLLKEEPYILGSDTARTLRYKNSSETAQESDRGTIKELQDKDQDYQMLSLLSTQSISTTSKKGASQNSFEIGHILQRRSSSRSEAKFMITNKISSVIIEEPAIEDDKALTNWLDPAKLHIEQPNRIKSSPNKMRKEKAQNLLKPKEEEYSFQNVSVTNLTFQDLSSETVRVKRNIKRTPVSINIVDEKAKS